ncbi:hypothetical protein CBS101457_006849 [Exobasidium rhododendri]|nr:hypothetical protein CBS101457_006849 [Exobasidium rhododendri]
MSLTNLDRRRANPPVTTPPSYSTASASSSSRGKAIRSDLQSARPIFVQTGLVSQASGSAYYESDSIKVACAIYGPKQIKSKTYSNEAELNVDVRFASFATKRRKRSGKDTESNSVGDAVRSALLPSLRLDLLPKASIDVFITILEVAASRGKGEGQDDEACTAAAATVASCALADAGIEMWGLVIGVNAIISVQGQLIVDPIHSEADEGTRSAMSLWSMPALGTVTAIEQWGEMSLEEVETIMQSLQAASTSMHYTVAKALKDSYLLREQNATKKQ